MSFVGSQPQENSLYSTLCTSIGALGKHFPDVPCVVRVAMQDTAISLISEGFNVNLFWSFFELSRQRYWFAPGRTRSRPPFVKHPLVIGQLRYSIVNAGVPQEPPLGCGG